jgi:MFS family permease
MFVAENMLLVATAGGLFLGGLTAAVIGSIKLPMARRLAIDDGRVGVLVATFSITFLPVVLASGWLIDHVGARLVFICSMVGIAGGLAALAAAARFFWAIGAAVLLSIAWSTLINVVHVMIPIAFEGSIAVGTNIADVFFSLGALSTPLLAASMVRGQRYRGLLLLIGGFALLAGTLCLLLPSDSTKVVVEVATKKIESQALLLHPRIWLCGLCLCLFGPLETTFATWTSSYLVEKGYSERFGTRMISGFWGSSMEIGRASCRERVWLKV